MNRRQLFHSTAKAALLNFSRSAAMDLAHEGIRVNTITPCAMEHQLWTNMKNEIFDQYQRAQGLTVAHVARDNAEALRQLAMGPQPPDKVRLTGAVTPDAKISWLAEDDSERMGFEILWRETTEARWRVYDFVPSAGETVLKTVSTDNHFFAVRAVGKNGARSGW